MDREALAARIAGRVRAMLEAGWLDEVRALVDRGFGAWLTAIAGDRLRGARASTSTVGSRSMRPWSAP